MTPSALASDEGTQGRQHAHRSAEPCSLQRHIAHVVVRRPVLPMGRVALAGDDDQPQPRHGREHGRSRSDDDVVPPLHDLQPPSVPRPLVPPDQQANALPERLHDRRRGRRNRRRLRHQHDRPPPTVETATNDLDDSGHLVLRRRPKHERARAGGDGRQKSRPLRYPEKRSEDEAGVRSAGPRAPCLGNGAPPAHRQPIPLQMRPGAAPPARSPRPTERCTARSPTASARASRRRRTGRARRPSSRSASASRTPRRGPSTHPRISRPWNGTCTSEPRPASSSGGKQVRERTVEAEDRAVDADRDRALQETARATLHVIPRLTSRRRGGGRRRGRSPPRGTLCARSARTRPSRGRWDVRAAGRG